MAQTFTSTEVTTGTNVFGDNQSQRVNENTLRSNFSGSSQPSDPVVGQHWYDTGNNREMTYDGTSWVAVDTNTATQVDVKNSAGNLSNLKSFLSVAHNDDGTLKVTPTSSIDEFKENSIAVTYVNPTTFTTPNDLTGIFTQYRKVKVYLSASTAISSVSSSSYNGVSNVTTVVLSTSAMDATLVNIRYSIVQYGTPDGGSFSGNITAKEYYSNGCFRTYNDGGWYSETYGGGWHMTDSDWIRSYNNKGVYIGGKMQADGGLYGALHGTADNATHAGTADNANTVIGTYHYENGGRFLPNHFGKNRVGFLMSNDLGGNHKNWLVMDNYDDNDAGGATALGLNRMENRAYIMRSNADRQSWAESAELITSANIGSQSVAHADNAGGVNGYTAAQLIGETSHATNGYHKFPDGTIIQWANVTCNNNSTASVSWPITFPNACLGAVVSVNTSTLGDVNSKVYGWTTTGATVFNGEGGASANVFVQAIGY